MVQPGKEDGGMMFRCIDGCKYFEGLDRRNKTICARIPTPKDVDPYMGCYWGEKAEKEEQPHEDPRQGGLFDEQRGLF
jgi:hypothetical protein